MITDLKMAVVAGTPACTADKRDHLSLLDRLAGRHQEFRAMAIKGGVSIIMPDYNNISVPDRKSVV